MGVVPRVRRCEQRGVCGAVRRIGSLPLLHAMGADGRGSLARRSVEFGHLLVGAADAGWRQPRVGPERGGHAPVAPVDCASWLAVHRGRGCVCDSRGDLARAQFACVGSPFPRHVCVSAIAQLTVSAIDWTLAAAVLYVLLPPSPATFVNVLAAFLLAQLLGLASHIPGGIGVFEGLIVFALSPFLTASQLLPALVVYRAIYYVAAAVGRAVGLVVDEALAAPRTCRCDLRRRLAESRSGLTPQMLATFTFVAGVMLLFSGATPADAERLQWLDRLLPLGVIEASHVTGSIAGAVLLLLSQGLARRLDAAYYLTMVTVIAGVVASLLKGFDYEEALLLVGADRGAARIQARLQSQGGVLCDEILGPPGSPRSRRRSSRRCGSGCSHSSTSSTRNDLWWQFELEGNASRFLRGSVGAATAVLLFAVARLIRHAPHEVEPPSERGSRGRGPHHRRAGLDVSVSRLPRRQGAALRRSSRGVHHVRRAGADVGGARRSRWAARARARSDTPVHRALRRLRRHAGVLRGRNKSTCITTPTSG